MQNENLKNQKSKIYIKQVLQRKALPFNPNRCKIKTRLK